MTYSVAKLGLGAALLFVTASAAFSGEMIGGQVTLTRAGAACPGGLLDAAKPVTVSFALPGASSAPSNASVTLSGEFRDFVVQGCTVAFSGGTGDPLSYVSLGVESIAHQRGCRGYCGL